MALAITGTSFVTTPIIALTSLDIPPNNSKSGPIAAAIPAIAIIAFCA